MHKFTTASNGLCDDFSCSGKYFPLQSQPLSHLVGMSAKNNKKTIHFVSLGCARNLVDSEVMLGLTTNAGYAVTDDASKAHVIVVNTCGFVDSAKAESIEHILEMADMKERGECETLVMTGCLAQRYSGELQDELPEVDYFLGTGEFPRIAEVL